MLCRDSYSLDVTVTTDTFSLEKWQKKMEVAMRRKKLSYKKSKKLFRRTGSKTHKRNSVTYNMRGGIRL